MPPDIEDLLRACGDPLVRDWLEQAGEGLAGIDYLAPHDPVDPVVARSPQAVVLDFRHFADGRPYSQAAALRQEWAFDGVIAALGGTPDNRELMLRCGVDRLLGEAADGAATSHRELEPVYRLSGRRRE